LRGPLTILKASKSIELRPGAEKNPIDLIYKQLETKLEKMPSNSKEFELVEQLMTTHGKTHSYFSLQLIDVFKINNSRDKAKIWPFRKLSKKLLWKGAKTPTIATYLT
jgi:poly [ADP-ribose] polymerase